MDSDGCIDGNKELHCTRMVYSLCSDFIEEKVDADTLIQSLDELKSDNSLESVIVDVLSIFEIEAGVLNGQNTASRNKFLELVKTCKRLVSVDLMKERLEFETLHVAGIIPSKEALNQKYVKIKTRIFYKQQKFNLLREESEGYAKLFTLLCHKSINAFPVDQIAENIKSLIGFFNLDPNRVLDIILEAMECQPSMHKVYTSILSKFVGNDDNLCQIIGFKFQCYWKANLSAEPSLYMLASRILQAGFVDLNALIPHLSPPLDTLTDGCQESTKSAATKNATETNNGNSRDETKKENQILCLIQYCIETGNIANAHKLLSIIPKFRAVQNEFIATSLCSYIESAIEPLYRTSFSLPVEFVYEVPFREDTISISSYDSFIKEIVPDLLFLGPYVHFSSVVFTKLVRICSHYLQKKQSGRTSMFYAILTLLDEVFLPGISLMGSNEAVCLELWNLLKLLPYELRYRLYGRWKSHTYAMCQELTQIKNEVAESIKYVIRRLTKDNVKGYSRQIAKLTHCNPIIVLDYVLDSVQRYDNLIVPIVDALKYLSPLSYDILIYNVIVILADPSKQQLKHDGINLSTWFKSLSLFTSLILRKYPVDLTGIIQYVINQMKIGKCLDLLLLQDIVQKMCGVEMINEMTDHQLECLSGGELLRTEGGYFNTVRNVRKSYSRLKDTLINSKLVLPLCALMAQLRERIVFQTELAHTKLIGHLYDQCQNTLIQFVSFLSVCLTPEEHADIFPSIYDLITEFHVPVDIAFMLSRSYYQFIIQMKFEELRKQDKSIRSPEKPNKLQRFIEASEMVLQPLVQSMKNLQLNKFPDEKLPSLNGKQGEETWDVTCSCPSFYVTFWTGSMYDFQCPSKAYDRQRASIQTLITQTEESKELVSSKRKKEIERLESMLEKLNEEESKQKDHLLRIKARLEREKDEWFSKKTKTKTEIITEFLQLCIFPRCLLSEIDAVYCAKFINTVHMLKIPNFSTIICYDKIFSDITNILASCTQDEADRYGRFLLSLLSTVMVWHSERSIYEKECLEYPGFLTMFRHSSTVSKQSQQREEQLDYENFRHVCYKWHYKLTRCFIVCLESDEYVQIRNSFKILTKLMPQYPRILSFYGALEKRVERIRQTEKDKRPDLNALAIGYLGLLRQKKSSMVDEFSFHSKAVSNNENNRTPTTVLPSSLPSPSANSGQKETNSVENGVQHPSKDASYNHIPPSPPGNPEILISNFSEQNITTKALDENGDKINDVQQNKSEKIAKVSTNAETDKTISKSLKYASQKKERSSRTVKTRDRSKYRRNSRTRLSRKRSIARSESFAVSGEASPLHARRSSLSPEKGKKIKLDDKPTNSAHEEKPKKHVLERKDKKRGSDSRNDSYKEYERTDNKRLHERHEIR